VQRGGKGPVPSRPGRSPASPIDPLPLPDDERNGRRRRDDSCPFRACLFESSTAAAASNKGDFDWSHSATASTTVEVLPRRTDDPCRAPAAPTKKKPAPRRLTNTAAPLAGSLARLVRSFPTIPVVQEGGCVLLDPPRPSRRVAAKNLFWIRSPEQRNRPTEPWPRRRRPNEGRIHSQRVVVGLSSINGSWLVAGCALLEPCPPSGIFYLPVVRRGHSLPRRRPMHGRCERGGARCHAMPPKRCRHRNIGSSSGGFSVKKQTTQRGPPPPPTPATTETERRTAPSSCSFFVCCCGRRRSRF
jgi:hypothetical protein